MSKVHNKAEPLKHASGVKRHRITSAERECVLHVFNDVAAPYPENGLIHELFAAQAKKASAEIAIVCGNQQLTYAQLNGRGNHVAHRLLAQGVGPGDRVGLYAERNLETVVGMLAILKAGAAYVPLDRTYPAGRLGLMIEDSMPAVVLAPAAVIEQLPRTNCPVLVLDAAAQESQDDPAVSGLTSRSLAYVLYTSGSTGRPKGVMVEHRSVIRLVINTSCAPISAADRVAHCASPSFDAATWEIWAALLNAARLVIVPQCTLLEPQALNRMLVEQSVTALFLTAGLFHEYVDALEQAFGHLVYLLTGGDVINPAAVARALSKASKPKHLMNAYGPTETTTFATTFEVTSLNMCDRPLPIGRPITNTSIYILDESREPVPIGVAGEIYIGGPGVARGYLNQPALTAERFVVDPFDERPGAMLYRSGDRGRWRDDGNIEFLGRNDVQVKIRGFRVEPREVEAALQRHPRVKHAVVTVQTNALGHKRLIGYVGADTQHLRRDSVTDGQVSAELREFLRDTLPLYMIPAEIVVLDELPLTANGKVDRRQLPEPNSGNVFARTYAAPRSPIESELCEVWQLLLDLEQVGIDDDFFELGGDSIVGTRVSSLVLEGFSVELSALEVFRYPTIRKLARRIESAACAAADHARNSSAAAATENDRIDRPPGVRSVPLSFQQEAFCQFAGAYPNWPFWCSTELRLRGELNIGLLDQALQIVVRRHDVLRTRIVMVDGVRYQQIDPPNRRQLLQIVPLLGIDHTTRSAEAGRYLDRLFGEPLDSPADSLFEVRLLRLAEQEHVLALGMHHVICDGVSLVLFFRELWRIYADLARGCDPVPCPPRMQYADYANWQHSADRASLSRCQRYWSSKLAGATPLQMPTDALGEECLSAAPGELHIYFDEQLSRAVHDLAQNTRTAPALVMLGLYAAHSARWTEQRDFVLSLGVTGRSRPEQIEVLGPFACQLPLRVELSGKEAFVELLQRLSQQFLEGSEYLDFGNLSFGNIPNVWQGTAVNWVGDAAELAGARPPGGERTVQFEIEPYRTRSAQLESGIPENFKLTCELMWRFEKLPHGMHGRVYYRTDLFAATTIEKFCRDLEQFVRHIVCNPADGAFACLA